MSACKEVIVGTKVWYEEREEANKGGKGVGIFEEKRANLRQRDSIARIECLALPLFMSY